MDLFASYLSLPVTLFGILALQALGLQLIVGGAGMLSLGHAAFFAIGGYTAAVFSVLVAPHYGIENSAFVFATSLLLSALLSSVCAFLFVTPSLRLRGDYFAIATLGLSQIVENVLYNTPSVGGASGFIGIPKYTSLWMVWTAVLLIILFLHRFYKTPLGYSVLCTREDEIVARSMGISPERSKQVAFVVGCAITGLAGGFYVHTFQFISPQSAGFGKSVEILLAVVIGGMFSIWGSLFGAALLVLLPEVLRFLPDTAAPYSMLIFSFIVLVVVIRKRNHVLERGPSPCLRSKICAFFTTPHVP